MSRRPIAVLSGLVDSFFRRAFVESRFAPRRVDGHVEWLSRSSMLLSTLTERELFPLPAPVLMRELGQGRYRGQKTQLLAWDLPPLPAAELFGLAVKTSAPRVTLVGQGQRPLWVLVHGWLGGSRFMDEVFWPLRQLFHTHDVALVLLPGHGVRSLPGYSPFPSFPCRNPVRNLLGLLTAVTELRQLVRWLRGLGYDEIGVAGSSLGVQVAALLATVEPCAERYLFDRPLSDLNDPLRRRLREGKADMTRLTDALLDFYRPVSPLCRPSRVAPDQVDVLLGREDRVAGLREGEALARHFGVEAQSFPTGHVLSIGRESVIVELMRKLGDS